MRGISALALVLFPAYCFAAQYNLLTISPDASTQAGIVFGDPLLLNNLGEVAGTYRSQGPDGSFVEHAFRTQPDATLNPASDSVGEFGSDTSMGPLSQTYALNDLGQVLGGSTTNAGTFPTFLTDGSGKINSNTQNLGSLGASFVNDRDQLAGSNNGVAFRTEPNQPYNPATDNLGTVAINALNNLGQVLGNMGRAGTYFLTAPDGPVPSTNLGPNFVGNDVNDLGQVGGYVLLPDNTTHAFVTAANQPYPDGSDLGRLAGAFAVVRALNDDGVAVGFSDLADGSEVGFVTVQGIMTDLNTLIDPASRLRLTDALQINDNGQILAFAHNAANGEDSVVLLTPTSVPEPTSLTLLATSSLLFLRRRRA